jgi:hypothetical protein
VGASPLATPTYDGSGQATHPSVWVFDTPWNGYTHWMAMTPYPFAADALENPSILVSNDGQTWVVPPGLINPIDPKPGPLAAYNADPELFYDADNDRLVCFYLEFDGTNTKYVRYRHSSDGVAWSSEFNAFSTTVSTENPVSQSIRKIGSTWVMWYVDTVPSPNTLVKRTASDYTGTWSAPTVLKWSGLPTNREPWHPMIWREGSTYRGVFNVCALNTTGSTGANTIHLASSVDGDNWDIGPAIISPNAASWMSQRTYRASAVVSGDTVRMWVGGITTGNVWRIGYGTIPVAAFPPPA